MKLNNIYDYLRISLEMEVDLNVTDLFKISRLLHSFFFMNSADIMYKGLCIKYDKLSSMNLNLVLYTV